MVSRTCKTFHGEALDRRFDEMNDVKFNAANLSRCTHRRILNAHVALNGVSGTHRRAGTPPPTGGSTRHTAKPQRRGRATGV